MGDDRSKRDIRFGVIGCGLMGREFASAAGRWMHLVDLDFRPVITAVCDTQASATEWFTRNVPSVQYATEDYRRLIDDPEIDAVYCAVPHNLHEQMYVDVIRGGKHLLGEKPFGIDREANQSINRAIESNPDVLVRCSSEFPFFPGALQITKWVGEERFGRIIEVEAGFWHSSDLNPDKAINWKRKIETNGAYGCMGDLGMHVLHLPLRFGWMPRRVTALLSNIVTERPDGMGNVVPCETWDNATLATEVERGGYRFPMTLSTKRIAPGHSNTWFIRVLGTRFSAEFSTQFGRQVRYMEYDGGAEQAWCVMDVPYRSAYPAITAPIFEFGFSDAILQMWAAFCDEIANGNGMRQPFRCVTPEEARLSHELFTAALESESRSRTVEIGYDKVAVTTETQKTRRNL